LPEVFVDFKSQVEAQIAEAEGRDLDHYLGHDWWQIQHQEEFVFAIDIMRFPRMSTALSMFRIFTGQVAAEDYHIDPKPAAEERKRRPDLIEKGISVDGFQHFARDYAGLTFRESAAVYTKNKFWQVRNGIMRYDDEPKDE
jgi:hypothetical protein